MVEPHLRSNSTDPTALYSDFLLGYSLTVRGRNLSSVCPVDDIAGQILGMKSQAPEMTLVWYFRVVEWIDEASQVSNTFVEGSRVPVVLRVYYYAHGPSTQLLAE